MTIRADQKSSLHPIFFLRSLTVHYLRRRQKIEENRKMKNKKDGFAGCEEEASGELRLFCVFYNGQTGKYRLTQGDAVFVITQLLEVDFHEAIAGMIKRAKSCGVDVSFFEGLDLNAIP